MINALVKFIKWLNGENAYQELYDRIKSDLIFERLQKETEEGSKKIQEQLQQEKLEEELKNRLQELEKENEIDFNPLDKYVRLTLTSTKDKSYVFYMSKDAMNALINIYGKEESFSELYTSLKKFLKTSLDDIFFNEK